MGRYTSEIKRLYELLEKRLGEVPLSRRPGLFHRRYRNLPWTRNHDAQGVKWEDHPSPRALVQCHQ